MEDPGVDDLLAQFSPAPDLNEEVYRSQLAFVTLLNFPRVPLRAKLVDGANWSVEQWAAARLADAVPCRTPRMLDDMAREAHQRARDFYYNFHIPIGCVVTTDGARPFPPRHTVLAHWALREELRSFYGAEDGATLQRVLARIMGRHIDGSIPNVVMAGTARAWEPLANTLEGRPVADADLVGPKRYVVWRDLFALARAADPYYPEFPTHIERATSRDAQIAPEIVETLLRSVLEAPVRRDVLTFVRARLGRSLEAFDLYYCNVAPPEPIDELNAAVARRFSDVASFQEQLPQILRELGFRKRTAEFLAAHIQVDPARGSGHASPARLLEYKSFLRTSHAQGRLHWTGLVTAMHELGHCVEQVFSLHRVPRPALLGVPTLGITEGMAFTFQDYARAVIGMPYPPQHREITTINTYLNACEIAGAGLVDLLMWRWLYANPDATAEQLRAATLQTADAIWSQYFGAYYGADDNRLLAAYQHMIGMMLYLPNYTVGHIVAHQVRSHLTPATLAREIERMCALGNLTPDLWLQRAIGQPLSAQQLIDDAAAAVAALQNAPIGTRDE